MNSQTEKLLIEIQAAVRCPYLSDLHTPSTVFDANAKQLVLTIPDSRYSIETWSEAATYVTRTKGTYPTPAAAKKAIVSK